MKGQIPDASCILAQDQKEKSLVPPTPITSKPICRLATLTRDRTEFAQILAPASHLTPPQKNNEGKMQQSSQVMLNCNCQRCNEQKQIYEAAASTFGDPVTTLYQRSS